MKEATAFGNGAVGQGKRGRARRNQEVRQDRDPVTLTPEQDAAMRKAMDAGLQGRRNSRVGQPLIDEFLKETGRRRVN